MKKIVSSIVTLIFIATLMLGIINSVKVEAKVSNEKNLAAVFPFPPPIPKKKDD